MKHFAIVAALFLATTAVADTDTAHGPPPAPALPMPFVIEFDHGATVDFADFKQTAPGPLRGYVYVRMAGELVVIPVYQPTDMGQIYRTEPRVIQGGGR